MSFYQKVYLKSEEWKSLRKQRILRDRFICQLCLKRPKRSSRKFGSGFQVHHLRYKKLYDIESKDLRSLCANCHKKVHSLMKKYPKMKTLDTKTQWLTVVYHLRPESRATLSGMIKGKDKDGQSCRQRAFASENKKAGLQENFEAAKKALFESGLICKNRMKWRESFRSDERIKNSVSKPKELLSAYIESTMRDPRRLIPSLYDPRNLLLEQIFQLTNRGALQ